MSDYYRDKIAVVTGAGSGIGQAIATLLGRHGARVHCADIDGAAAAETAEAIGNAAAHTVDVTDAAAVDDLARTVYAADNRVDLLFNNAGIGHAGRVEDTELEDWRRVLDVNVMGMIHGIHAFLPRMQEQGGRSHIVNTASLAGLISPPQMAPYAASKHAVVGLSESLASDLHGTDIAVTILCPGIINTPIVATSRLSGETAGRREHVIDYYRRKGATPDKVAADLLKDVRRRKLFCLTPRLEVGPAWLIHRLSPRLMGAVMRAGAKKIIGGD